MKIKISLLFVLVVSFSLKAQFTEPRTWEDFNLVGKVKSIEERSVNSPDSDKLQNREIFITEFNKDGNATKKTQIRGLRVTESIFAYDNSGKLLKLIYRNLKNDSLKTESIVTFRYKKDSVFVNADITEDKETQTKTFVMILKDNLPIKYYGKDDEGNTEEQIIQYDAHGNIVSETGYKNGEFKQKHQYTYEYDENGNMMKKIYVGQGIKPIIFFPNRLIKEWGEYEYRYEYDDKGNYIKQTAYENGGKYYEYTREIEYYH